MSCDLNCVKYWHLYFKRDKWWCKSCRVGYYMERSWWGSPYTSRLLVDTTVFDGWTYLILSLRFTTW